VSQDRYVSEFLDHVGNVYCDSKSTLQGHDQISPISLMDAMSTRSRFTS
jgi:hypothetical protein